MEHHHRSVLKDIHTNGQLDMNPLQERVKPFDKNKVPGNFRRESDQDSSRTFEDYDSSSSDDYRSAEEDEAFNLELDSMIRGINHVHILTPKGKKLKSQLQKSFSLNKVIDMNLTQQLAKECEKAKITTDVTNTENIVNSEDVILISEAQCEPLPAGTDINLSCGERRIENPSIQTNENNVFINSQSTSCENITSIERDKIPSESVINDSSVPTNNLSKNPLNETYECTTHSMNPEEIVDQEITVQSSISKMISDLSESISVNSGIICENKTCEIKVPSEVDETFDNLNNTVLEIQPELESNTELTQTIYTKPVTEMEKANSEENIHCKIVSDTSKIIATTQLVENVVSTEVILENTVASLTTVDDPVKDVNSRLSAQEVLHINEQNISDIENQQNLNIVMEPNNENMETQLQITDNFDYKFCSNDLIKNENANHVLDNNFVPEELTEECCNLQPEMSETKLDNTVIINPLNMNTDSDYLTKNENCISASSFNVLPKVLDETLDIVSSPKPVLDNKFEVMIQSNLNETMDMDDLKSEEIDLGAANLVENKFEVIVKSNLNETMDDHKSGIDLDTVNLVAVEDKQKFIQDNNDQTTVSNEELKITSDTPVEPKNLNETTIISNPDSSRATKYEDTNKCILDFSIKDCNTTVLNEQFAVLKTSDASEEKNKPNFNETVNMNDFMMNVKSVSGNEDKNEKVIKCILDDSIPTNFVSDLSEKKSNVCFAPTINKKIEDIQNFKVLNQNIELDTCSVVGNENRKKCILDDSIPLCLKPLSHEEISNKFDLDLQSTSDKFEEVKLSNLNETMNINDFVLGTELSDENIIDNTNVLLKYSNNTDKLMFEQSDKSLEELEQKSNLDQTVIINEPILDRTLDLGSKQTEEFKYTRSLATGNEHKPLEKQNNFLISENILDKPVLTKQIKTKSDKDLSFNLIFNEPDKTPFLQSSQPFGDNLDIDKPIQNKFMNKSCNKESVSLYDEEKDFHVQTKLGPNKVLPRAMGSGDSNVLNSSNNFKNIPSTEITLSKDSAKVNESCTDTSKSSSTIFKWIGQFLSPGKTPPAESQTADKTKSTTCISNSKQDVIEMSKPINISPAKMENDFLSLVDETPVPELMSVSAMSEPFNESRNQTEDNSDLLNEIIQLRRIASEKEAKLKDMRQLITDYRQKGNEISLSIEKYEKVLAQKVDYEKKTNIIVNKFEKRVQQLHDENKATALNNKVELQKWQEDRDLAVNHLSAVENAFSNLHKKYEQCKVVIEILKTNQEVMKNTNSHLRDIFAENNSIMTTLENHASDQLIAAKTDFENTKRQNEGDTMKWNALLKKAGLKTLSLEKELKQKQTENQELTQLCDGLIQYNSKD